jgi:hypothetical protein
MAVVTRIEMKKPVIADADVIKVGTVGLRRLPGLVQKRSQLNTALGEASD